MCEFVKTRGCVCGVCAQQRYVVYVCVCVWVCECVEMCASLCELGCECNVCAQQRYAMLCVLVCVCVCVCVCFVCVYMYMYICVCVCVCGKERTMPTVSPGKRTMKCVNARVGMNACTCR